MRMKFGLSGSSGGLESLSDDRLLTIIPKLEKWGYSSVWINEEHFQRNRSCFSPLILGTTFAALSTELRIGFSALITPLHHPLRLAEEIASMDRLSKGRIDFGVSRGHPGHYFDSYRIDATERTALFRNGINEILGYWKTGIVHAKNNELEFAPMPIQMPHPPIYVAAYSDESVKWAAESGHHLILHGIQSIDSIKRCLHVFKEFGGHIPATPVGRFVYVGESDQKAKEDIWPTICKLTTRLKKIRSNRFSLINSEDDLEPEAFYEKLAIIGGPETCAMKIKQLNEELGIQHINLLSSFFGIIPAPLLEGSLERFSSEVIPRICKN